MEQSVESGDENWQILAGLTYLVARTFDLPKNEAESRAMYLFSMTDIMLAQDAGQDIGLTEPQTVTAMVWNQWFDLQLGSTKIQRLFDRELRDHCSSVEKILSRFGGNLSAERAKDFRMALERAYFQRSNARFEN